VSLETVWLMREDGLRRRSPAWVLRSFWVPLVLLLIPLMLAGFTRVAVLRAGAAALAFVVYAVIAYMYWRGRHRSGRLLDDRSTVLIVLGYDGFALLFISIQFLAASLLSAQEVPGLSSSATALTGVAYLSVIVVVGVRGKHILGYMADHLNRPLAPAMRWLLALPATIVAAGIAFSAVLGSQSMGWLFISAVSALGAFALIPFATLTLYQIPVFLVWRP
jgi:hypothetical protein